MDKRVLWPLLAVIAGGTMVGYSIGYVSVALAWYDVVSNCTSVTGQDACEWVSSDGNRGCIWANGTCDFVSRADCTQIVTDGACKAVDACAWDDNNNVCQHINSWDANQQGWIATTMIIGGLVGSFLGQPCVERLGLKRSIVLTGVVAAVSTVFVIVGWTFNDAATRFAFLLVFRTLNGVAVGFASIFCPMYVGDVAPERVAVKIGVCFQVFLTLGIMLAAGLGYGLQPKKPSSKSDVERFQVLNYVNLLLSVLLVPVGVAAVAPPERYPLRDGEKRELYHLVNPDGQAPAARFWMTKMMWGGVVLSAVQQLCGINAIMNYVPNIANTVGLSNPFLSNFIVMIWNFVTTLVSIPIASRVEPQTSYIAGSVLAAIACFITGIPTYPGVTTDESVRNGFVGFGILLFIAAFEVGMGPSFYVLAQSIFPANVRAKGCSFTMAVQFFFNIGVNYGFPVLVQAFSGGVNSNQKQGLAIMFFFFGGASFVLIAFFKTMGIKRQPLEAPARDEIVFD